MPLLREDVLPSGSLGWDGRGVCRDGGGGVVKEKENHYAQASRAEQRMAMTRSSWQALNLTPLAKGAVALVAASSASSKTSSTPLSMKSSGSTSNP